MLVNMRRTALLALPLVLFACGGTSEGGKKPSEATKSETAEPAKTGGAAEMALGSPDAHVTVIEYASVTCPHCAVFHETIFPQIKSDYIDTGKVRFIFREFPTPPQGLSYVGSVLARCAADRGGSDAYFLVVNALFQNQETWVYGDDPKEELLKIAAQAGMDQPAFDACLKRQDYVDLIEKTAEQGSEKFGINATPSFVIDGERKPIRTFEDFQTAYEAAAAKAD
jgi:protein-disulfide isomerase